MNPKGDIVLVTASNGRIGTAVMKRLRESFDNVVGFDLSLPSRHRPSACESPSTLHRLRAFATDCTCSENITGRRSPLWRTWPPTMTLPASRAPNTTRSRRKALAGF